MLHRPLALLVAFCALTTSSIASAQDTEEEDDGAWIDPPAESRSPPTDVYDDRPDADAEVDEDAAVADEAEALPETEPAPILKPAEVPPPCGSCGLPPHYLTGHRKFLRPIEGHEPPEGYVWSKRSRQGVWGTGIGLSAAMYGFTLLTTGLLSETENDDDIFRFGSFPLIGPFIAAGHDIDDTPRGFLIGMGLGQIAGFAMIVGGLSVRIPTWRRERAGATTTAMDVSVQGNGATLEVSF
jgi:hypothetical protein